MRRYWIDKQQIQGELVEFTGEQLHHLRDVCRLDVGSKFEVLFEDSKAHFVEMMEMSKRQALAKILETRDIPPLPLPQINLAVSLPKFQKLDTIIEKSVELGVGQVLPFVSQFSFIRNLSKISDNKRQRWQKIVLSATQQCGRGELMQVLEPVSFSQSLEQLNRKPQCKCLFLYEGDGDMSLKSALSSLKTETIQEIWVFVGSEGGFSDGEVEQMRASGLVPITVGDQVLRVETACIAAVSMLHYHFRL